MPSRAKRKIIVNGKVEYKDPEPRAKVPCKVCGKPMLVASGQEAKYHKACRKLRHNKNAK